MRGGRQKPVAFQRDGQGSLLPIRLDRGGSFGAGVRVDNDGGTTSIFAMAAAARIERDGMSETCGRARAEVVIGDRFRTTIARRRCRRFELATRTSGAAASDYATLAFALLPTSALEHGSYRIQGHQETHDGTIRKDTSPPRTPFRLSARKPKEQ